MTFEEETCGDNVARGKSGKEVMIWRQGLVIVIKMMVITYSAGSYY